MSSPWRLPVVIGVMGALTLAGLYMGVLTLVQSWDHAVELFTTDWYFLLAIIVGFGVQVGLFTYVRTSLRSSYNAGSTALAGAGAGTSTVSMVACCAHHLTDVLPLVGVSGAAIFLADYRTPLMVLAIAINAAGIVVMLRLIDKIRRHACAPNLAERQAF